MNKFNLTASVLLSILATNAFAGGAAPFYLGATVGQSSADNNANQMDNIGLCQSAAFDSEDCFIEDGDTASHIYGGFQVSENIAIEVGYANLGNTASYHYTDPVTVTQETKGFTVAGVVRSRISKASPLHVYGKAGAIRWTTESHSSQDYPGSAEDSGVSPMAGVGLEYELNHNISLKAGWDRYFDIGESETLIDINTHDHSYDVNTLETDVDVYSAGINFSFL